MAYHFPKRISAARVATFVSTAAWIQGTSASEVSLPEEALNNFLKRHGVTTTVSRRQDPASDPADEEEKEEGSEEEDEDEEEGEESADSLSSSSVDTPGAPPSISTDSDEESVDSLPDSPQAGVAQGASGRPAIGSSDPPPLSTGAKVAIGVWTAVAVFAIAGLIFFFRRRRRARLAKEQINALRDEEIAREQEVMSQRISEPIMQPLYIPPPPPSQPPMEPVYLRGGGGGDGDGDGDGMVRALSVRSGSARAPSVRAPSIARALSITRAPSVQAPSVRAPTVREQSGQWMPVPPWQEDAPTWRDSQPWRQSQPSVVGARTGLPSSVRPPMPPFPIQNSKPEMDRRTEYTADTESTIFAYK